MSLLWSALGKSSRKKSYRRTARGTAPAVPARSCQAPLGEVPALEAAFARAQTAPSLAEGRGAGHSGSSLGKGELPAAPVPYTPGNALHRLPLRFPALPGKATLPGRTGGLLLTRYCLPSPLLVWFFFWTVFLAKWGNIR